MRDIQTKCLDLIETVYVILILLSLLSLSLTISSASDLGAILKKNWKDTASLVAKNSTLKIGIALPYMEDSTMYGRIIGPLLTICESHDCYFVCQGKSNRKQLLRFGGDRVDKSKILLFQDGVEDWFQFIRGLDFVISTRIHGGMAGIVNGVPTVIIPLHVRIMELVNVMILPYLSFEQFLSKYYTSLDQIMKDATKDFAQFESNRRNALKEYRQLLNSVSVEMDPALVHILQQENASTKMWGMEYEQ